MDKKNKIQQITPDLFPRITQYINGKFYDGNGNIILISTASSNSGYTGSQGTQGTQGVTGPQGIQGVQGTQGPQGITGSQGITGPQGSQGFTGPQGIQGDQGTQGPQGITGSQGIQGVQGTQGPQGITGPSILGVLDSQYRNDTFGATINNGTLYLQTANPTFSGLVSTASQVFGGVKYFPTGFTILNSGTGTTVSSILNFNSGGGTGSRNNYIDSSTLGLMIYTGGITASLNIASMSTNTTHTINGNGSGSGSVRLVLNQGSNTGILTLIGDAIASSAPTTNYIRGRQTIIDIVAGNAGSGTINLNASQILIQASKGFYTANQRQAMLFNENTGNVQARIAFGHLGVPIVAGTEATTVWNGSSIPASGSSIMNTIRVVASMSATNINQELTAVHIQPTFPSVTFSGVTTSVIRVLNSSGLNMIEGMNNGDLRLGNTGTTVSTSTRLKIVAGATGLTPIEMTSGPYNTNPVAGAIEFLTDTFTLTSTTGPTRKSINDLVVRNISASYSITGADELINCSTGSFGVTLPTAVGYTKQYVIKNSGNGIITLNTTSGQTIDNSSSFTLNQYDSTTIRSDGSNWIVSNRYPSPIPIWPGSWHPTTAANGQLTTQNQQGGASQSAAWAYEYVVREPQQVNGIGFILGQGRYRGALYDSGTNSMGITGLGPQPVNLLVDTGTFSLAASGVSSISFATQSLAPGVYWLVWLSSFVGLLGVTTYTGLKSQVLGLPTHNSSLAGSNNPLFGFTLPNTAAATASILNMYETGFPTSFTAGSGWAAAVGVSVNNYTPRESYLRRKT